MSKSRLTRLKGGAWSPCCPALSPVQVYLNLVLEYVPDTVYRINKVGAGGG